MILIDKQCVAIKNVTYSQIGFGVANEFELLDYEMDVSREEFLARMYKVYDDCIAELRRDDTITGEFDAPYPGALDYPTLDGYINEDGGSFFEFFHVYLKFDFFHLFFVEEDSSASFLVVSLEGMNFDHERVTIFGKLRKLI